MAKITTKKLYEIMNGNNKETNVEDEANLIIIKKLLNNESNYAFIEKAKNRVNINNVLRLVLAGVDFSSIKKFIKDMTINDDDCIDFTIKIYQAYGVPLKLEDENLIKTIENNINKKLKDKS